MSVTEESKWQHFSHDADIGIRGYGETLEEAFSQAATAMTSVICDVTLVRPLIRREIQCDAGDNELLLVDWLNALVYEMAIDHMLFSRFDLEIKDTRLEARVWGEPVDRKRHQPAVEVKGATYTALRVSRGKNGGWIAQCVIDV